MPLTLNQTFVNEFQALVDTVDRPELQIAALLVDLAWHYLQAGQDLRMRWSLLTRRQEEIALLVYTGHTYQQIAKALYLSRNSVRTHTRYIYARMGVASKQELRRLMLSSEILAEYIEKYRNPAYDHLQYHTRAFISPRQPARHQQPDRRQSGGEDVDQHILTQGRD